MLKPITKQEKAAYTLSLQAEKAREDLLSETYHDGYEGYLDIWVEITHNKKRVVMSVNSRKISNPAGKMPHPDAVRYYFAQGKGYKRMK